MMKKERFHSLLQIIWVATTRWMLLHGGDGQSYWVNMDQVTSMRAPNTSDLARFAKGVKCIITTTDGKFTATVETCGDIYILIAKNR